MSILDTNPESGEMVYRRQVTFSRMNHPVRAENFLPLQLSAQEFQKMIPRSVSSVVKGFKIGVTKETRKIMPDVQVWQRNYYEHIIRNESAFQKISKYIRDNPANWNDDEFFLSKPRRSSKTF